MCPACLTTLALIVTGSTSVGSLTALSMSVKRSRRRSTRNETISNVSERRTQDVNRHDHKSENCFAR